MHYDPSKLLRAAEGVRAYHVEDAIFAVHLTVRVTGDRVMACLRAIWAHPRCGRHYALIFDIDGDASHSPDVLTMHDRKDIKWAVATCVTTNNTFHRMLIRTLIMLGRAAGRRELSLHATNDDAIARARGVVAAADARRAAS